MANNHPSYVFYDEEAENEDEETEGDEDEETEGDEDDEDYIPLPRTTAWVSPNSHSSSAQPIAVEEETNMPLHHSENAVEFIQDEETEGDEDDEDYIPPIRTTARVSPNSSSSSAQPIVLEEETNMHLHQISENAVEFIEEEDDRRRGGEATSSSSLKRIEREVIPPGGELNGNDTDCLCCPICMEPWSSEGNHQVSCLPCGHVYGFSCIVRWIRQCRKNSAKCPQCSRKCSLKDVIRLYVSRIVVDNGEQQKKFLSLQSENEILKMKIANLHEKLRQDEEKMRKEKEKPTCLENVSLGEMHRRPSEITLTAGSQGRTPSGHNFGLNVGVQGSPHCSFALEDELVVDGARILDMDVSSQILILARRLSGMGGLHVLTKISLMYPYEHENIHLPPCTKAIRDLRISPYAGKLALFASLGKKLSILSMESNNIVHTYELPGPAWSCSWDLNRPQNIYAGLQNGMLLVFDMRQTARPMESINGLTCHPVHTIHSLVHRPPLPYDVRTLLSASSIGPSVWNTGGGVGERPFLVPETENQGVCISLAHCPSNDDIVASFRPKVQISNDIVGSQPSPSQSPTVPGQGILGSHVHIKRVGSSCYQHMGSTSANVNDVRMPKSAIISIENGNPLFACGDEVTRGLSLRELPSLRVVQSLRPHQSPILDVKYARSLGTGLLGCVSEDKLQLFSAKFS